MNDAKLLDARPSSRGRSRCGCARSPGRSGRRKRRRSRSFEKLAQVAQVVAQLLGRDRRVLPAFPGVAVARDPRGSAQARLAHLPELQLFVRVVKELHRGRIVPLQSDRSLAGACRRLPPCCRHRTRRAAIRCPAGNELEVARDGGVSCVHVPDQASSMPSRPIGPMLITSGTWSAALVQRRVTEHQQRARRRARRPVARSPQGSSRRCLRSRRARLRTWKPFSGSSRSRL